MTKNLVVVESPAKARTIERYLGPDYTVLASYGHVRDLPENPGKNQLGVDVEHDFAPQYVVNEDRRRQLATIEKAARRADAVYLATDLDREGEAIAWHVAEAAGVAPAKTHRVTFSEITADAIRQAFASPRTIDRNLVDAQQTRRIMDRLVGYTLSPLLWRKVRGGLSAGRVQSVAVRLVVEREREIRAFTAREYWTLQAACATGSGEDFSADVVRHRGAALEIADGETAAAHVDALSGAQATVSSVSSRRQKRNPAPPFTTSTLQQEASRRLGFNPRRTMRAAQSLYEGVDTGEGPVGLITYMRTDSTQMAKIAMEEARKVIGQRFGVPYVVAGGRTHKSRAKGAQEAHEAIRPTSFLRDPDSLAGQLAADEQKLYRLIWQRALASQMAPKELETTTAELAAVEYELRASATRTVFDGFSAVYTEGTDDDTEEEAERRLPALAEGEPVAVGAVTPTQHFTQPPPRYTEASLIKALEEHGIGRPSTYAATISTIVDRGYVSVVERRLRPEPVGEVVTDLLVEHFGEFVDVEFTARMEEELDEVARGQREWVPLLRDFYGPFSALVAEKGSELRRRDFTTEETDEICSEGHPMVIRLGRNGRFLACSLYPEHKDTRPLPGEEQEAPAVEGVGETCPECGEGTLVAKRGRFGAFAGCSRYPDCRYIHKTGPPPPEQLPFEVGCVKCGEGHLVARRARRTGNVFWGCSRYPKCDFTTSHRPLGAMHDADDGPVAERGEAALCLRCGAPIDVAPGDVMAGQRLAGGEPDPAALASPRKGGGGRRANGSRRPRRAAA
ncbi:MAG TPA: type I DNA topoisomerase [Candidatus Limnocylindrales bacterium]|nr:type I DNA topoisomerase [Candidatus Limnocylindrales bacterium]